MAHRRRASPRSPWPAGVSHLPPRGGSLPRGPMVMGASAWCGRIVPPGPSPTRVSRKGPSFTSVRAIRPWPLINSSRAVRISASRSNASTSPLSLRSTGVTSSSFRREAATQLNVSCYAWLRVPKAGWLIELFIGEIFTAARRDGSSIRSSAPLVLSQRTRARRHPGDGVAGRIMLWQVWESTTMASTLL
jgi:hypothetical protein